MSILNNDDTYTYEPHREKIITHTQLPCNKTDACINYCEHSIEINGIDDACDNSFDYSEKFDGIQIVNGLTIYFNLKRVNGIGKWQTSMLKELYRSIKGQLNVLLHNDTILFVNILDGNAINNSLIQYNYLLNKMKYTNVKNNIYIGGIDEYFDWFNDKFR